tara:strand:- start:815 stop:1165 length:351 start_codon:yes stop_codon:yes gene_type:complete
MTPGVFKNRHMKNRGYFKKYKKEPFESFETLEETYEMTEVLDFEIREAITKVLSTLTPREERVLRMRYGIGMNTDHTLEQVGQQFSVTIERIRQIEAKAIRKLKHPTKSKILREAI